jgi:hypothetical protein
MDSMSPIVDCGVHYVDVMCQMTRSKPVRVSGDPGAALRRAEARHVQLRPAAGHVRRRLGRLVRSRLGPDDERGRLLREGRDRPQGLRVDRRQTGRTRGRQRRRRLAHEDQLAAGAPPGTRRRTTSSCGPTSGSTRPTNPTTTGCACASSSSCCGRSARYGRALGLGMYVTSNGALLEKQVDTLVAAGLSSLTMGFYGTGEGFDSYTQRPSQRGRRSAASRSCASDTVTPSRCS